MINKSHQLLFMSELIFQNVSNSGGTKVSVLLWIPNEAYIHDYLLILHNICSCSVRQMFIGEMGAEALWRSGSIVISSHYLLWTWWSHERWRKPIDWLQSCWRCWWDERESPRIWRWWRAGCDKLDPALKLMSWRWAGRRRSRQLSTGMTAQRKTTSRSLGLIFMCLVRCCMSAYRERWEPTLDSSWMAYYNLWGHHWFGIKSWQKNMKEIIWDKLGCSALKQTRNKTRPTLEQLLRDGQTDGIWWFQSCYRGDLISESFCSSHV